jgi:hypothetical protein
MTKDERRQYMEAARTKSAPPPPLATVPPVRTERVRDSQFTPREVTAETTGQVANWVTLRAQQELFTPWVGTESLRVDIEQDFLAELTRLLTTHPDYRVEVTPRMRDPRGVSSRVYGNVTIRIERI